MAEVFPVLWGGGGHPSPESEGKRVHVLDFRYLEKLGLTAAEVQRLKEEVSKEIQERKLVFSSRYSKMEPQPTARLSNGYTIPLVGLGTWKAAKGEVQQAVLSALRAGYRHIDCASVYANEHEVGAALQEVLTEGVISREELFITSKLWNSDHAPARVEPAVRKTLSDLQLDYLDAYLIHFPSSMPGPVIRPSLLDVWRAMEALVDKGLVRSIGVSNFSVKKLQSILSEARIPIHIVQVEGHPYFRNDALIDFCRAKNIHVTAYSPLGSPDSAGIMQRAQDTPSPMKDPVVAEIASRLGWSPAQVLISWGLHRGTSVLPKSVNPSRIAANLESAKLILPERDFQKLNSLQIQVRMVPAAFLLSPAGPYKTLEDLWEN